MKQDFLPGLSAIFRTKHASLLVWPVSMTQRSDKNPVRVPWVHDDPPHHSSKFHRPAFRNKKLPAARARPLPPVLAPHEMVRSSATAAPGIVLGRTVLARQVWQAAEMHRA